MESVKLAEMLEALDVRTGRGSDVLVGGISIDSRTIRAGELFVAIRGPRFDGHDYVAEAFERGASAAVVERDARVGGVGGELVRVPDTVRALQDLAGWYRTRFDLPVVAVTGTNGKTTTKDMIAAVLSTRMTAMRTEGNLNNHIGVPLTLFRLSREHEVAVVEMGMSHMGEIARLAEIARPTVGVITNVSEAHLETLRDLDAVAEAKGELLEALPKEGVAVLNADDPRVMEQATRSKARVVTFGVSSPADTRAVWVDDSNGVSFEIEGGATVALPTPGGHNVLNALAAVAVGRVFGVDHAAAAAGLAAFEPSPMRMSRVTVGRWTVINDAYNANPGSLAAALRTLAALGRGRKKLAALGDMLELGERGPGAHREAGVLAAELGIDRLFLYGREVRALRDGAVEAGMSPERVHVFEDKRVLVRALGELLEEDAILLVKGSRAMRMEEVVELLRREAPAS